MTTPSTAVQRPGSSNRPYPHSGDNTPRDKPKISKAIPQQDAAQAERMRFYRRLWRDTVGYVEVAAGLTGAEIAARGWPVHPGELNDPNSIEMLLWTKTTYDQDKAAGRPHTRKLFQWPAQTAALDRHVAQLGRAYGNVYVSLSLYPSEADAKKRTRALPSRVLLVEDGPADPVLPYSFVVETSPYSRHGYYELDQERTPRELVTLAAGARDRIGGDASGTDREQLVRVPTTRNTKQKAGDFRVTLQETERTYAAADLARAFLPGGWADVESAPARRERSPDEAPNPATKEEIDRGQRLLASRRWRLMITRRPQLRILLIDRERIVIPGPYAAADDSGSMQVAAFVSNCRSNFPAPPPDDEIMCTALALRDTLRPGYNLDAYKADVQSMLDDPRYAATREPKATEHVPKALVQTRDAVPLAPSDHTPAPSRRRGRPIGSRAARVTAVLRLLSEIEPDTEGRHLYRLDILAERGQCCRRTISSILASAEAAGVLQRGQLGGPGGLPFVVWDANKSAQVWGDRPATVERITAPEIDAEIPPKGEHSAPILPSPQAAPQAPADAAPEFGAPMPETAAEAVDLVTEDVTPPADPSLRPRPGATLDQLVRWARDLVAERPVRGKHSRRAMAWVVASAERPEVEKRDFDAAWSRVLEVDRDRAYLAGLDLETLRQEQRARAAVAEKRRKHEQGLAFRAKLAEREGDTAKAAGLWKRQRCENGRAWSLANAAKRASGALWVRTNGAPQPSPDDVAQTRAGDAELRQIRDLRTLAALPDGWEWYPSDAPGYLRAKRLKDGGLTPLCRMARFDELLWECDQIDQGRRPAAWAGAPPVPGPIPANADIVSVESAGASAESARSVLPKPAKPALDPLSPLRYLWVMGQWGKVHEAARERGMTYDQLVSVLNSETPIVAPAAAAE